MQHGIDPKPFWPEKKPSVPEHRYGWFSPQNARLLKSLLTAETKMVIELGSWLGESTRFILEHAPNAIVYAIDTWEGGPDHQDPNSEWFKMLPTLYETFLVNMWSYQDRLIPVRGTTQHGMRFVHLSQPTVRPDLVYIDADHTYTAVCKDIETAHYLFNGAKLVGDDWGWGVDLPVQRAAKDMAQKFGYKIHVEGDWAWTYNK